jgi:hypothetical protein
MPRRLFAVFWWLVVVGSVGGAILFAEWLIEDIARYTPLPLLDFLAHGPLFDACAFCFRIYSWAAHFGEHSAYLMASLLLPYATLTIVRWIITGHWHFGPRW